MEGSFSMQPPRPTWTDEQIEQIVAALLRTGVIIAAATVLVGGIVYLIRHGREQPVTVRQKGDEAHVFQGEPAELESVRGILWGAWRARCFLCLCFCPAAGLDLRRCDASCLGDLAVQFA
jgi:Protein of unknown function (DUF1634)